jgi:hypothetical protein
MVIDGVRQLRIGDDTLASSQSPAKMTTFPLSFLMKYSLCESYRISQSVCVGLGPYFMHQGQMPAQIKDVQVTGLSTCSSEWISHLSRDLYLNLRMKYTHAFQTLINEIPPWDFTTWLGLNVRW